MKPYVIDCAACQASSSACGDCIMSFIAAPEFGGPVQFTQEEANALQVMAEVGLVPTLRLVANG